MRPKRAQGRALRPPFVGGEVLHRRLSGESGGPVSGQRRLGLSHLTSGPAERSRHQSIHCVGATASTLTASSRARRTRAAAPLVGHQTEGARGRPRFGQARAQALTARSFSENSAATMPLCSALCTRPVGRRRVARQRHWCASTANAVPRASRPACSARGLRAGLRDVGLHGSRNAVLVAVQPAPGEAHLCQAALFNSRRPPSSARSLCWQAASRACGVRPSPRSGWRSMPRAFPLSRRPV